MYELQGDLFFGTIEQLLRRLVAELGTVSYLILDVKRVMQVDDCSRILLAQMNEMLAREGKKLMFAHLPRATAVALGKDPQSHWTSFFPDTDTALEWCENQLIRQEHSGGISQSTLTPLAAMDIVAGFSISELMLFESIIGQIHYAAGVTIIREGDPADCLFLLAAGLVSVRLRLGDGTRQKRLSTITPGVSFGELALLDGGTRSADVIADEPSICYVMPAAKLDELAAMNPEIRSKLIFNIGRQLSIRLRRADAEIRSLEE